MKRLLLAAGLCMLTACESAAVKCQKGRDAAHGAWSAYVSELEAARDAATKTQVDVHSKLNGTVEPRLMPEAQKLADARYDRSAEAWLRASKTAFIELCGKDNECSTLRDQRVQAGATLEDVKERLPPALAARDATKRELDAALSASKAAIIDAERPALKAAQLLTLALSETCDGVPAP